jgi:hypothetical protein
MKFMKTTVSRPLSLVATWEDMATLTAPVSGQLEYHDIASLLARPSTAPCNRNH